LTGVTEKWSYQGFSLPFRSVFPKHIVPIPQIKDYFYCPIRYVSAPARACVRRILSFLIVCYVHKSLFDYTARRLSCGLLNICEPVLWESQHSARLKLMLHMLIHIQRETRKEKYPAEIYKIHAGRAIYLRRLAK